MEIIITITSFVLLGALFASPLLILYMLGWRKFKFKFLAYLVVGVVATLSITLIYAWWVDTSNQILLSHFGYDLEALNDSQRFQKVLPENIERVKNLEVSMLGIGWPLKAFMTYTFFAPFLLFGYLLVYFTYLIRSNMKLAKPE